MPRYLKFQFSQPPFLYPSPHLPAHRRHIPFPNMALITQPLWFYSRLHLVLILWLDLHSPLPLPPDPRDILYGRCARRRTQWNHLALRIRSKQGSYSQWILALYISSKLFVTLPLVHWIEGVPSKDTPRFWFARSRLERLLTSVANIFATPTERLI